MERLKQADGTVKFRACKKKAGLRRALGTVRESYEQALLDRQYLTWDERGNPVDLRQVQSSSQPVLDSAPLFRDFMLECLADRGDQLSYGAFQRDEIVWRARVWPSDLGATPIDRIDDQMCGAFIRAQKKLKPVKDRKGRVQLFEIGDDGRPDPDCPVGPRDASSAHVWIAHYKSGDQPVTIVKSGCWAHERRTPQPIYVETYERPAISTIRLIGAVLSAYFEIARERRLISVNPIARLKYPKARKGALVKKSLTAAEAANLSANLLKFSTGLANQGERFEAMVLTARDTGMRRGEICGLLRDRVARTAEGPYLRVDNGRVRIPGGMEDSSPKTGRVREIPIAEDTFERIMALPARRDPEKGLVYAFSTESGRPVRPDNFSRSFRAFRASIGMPSLKLHNLRHTYISLMLRAGVDVKTIQALVGHTTPKMIMEIYAETFQDTHRESVGRFMQLLREAQGDRAAGEGEAEVIELGGA